MLIAENQNEKRARRIIHDFERFAKLYERRNRAALFRRRNKAKKNLFCFGMYIFVEGIAPAAHTTKHHIQAVANKKNGVEVMKMITKLILR